MLCPTTNIWTGNACECSYGNILCTDNSSVSVELIFIFAQSQVFMPFLLSYSSDILFVASVVFNIGGRKDF